MAKKGFEWTRENRAKLAKLWSDQKITKEDILNIFSECKWFDLKKQSTEMGLVWNKQGICNVELPHTGLERPFEIKSKNCDPRIMVINSPFVGVEQRYGGNDSLLSNALRAAQEEGCDAVVVSGNVFYIDVVRYSKLKPFRARVSAIEPDEDIVSYPETVKEEMGGLSERIARGDLVFLTFKNKLDHVIGMVQNAFFRDGQPIFKKKIYICFGNVEEILSAWLTNEDVAKRVVEELGFIGARLASLKKELKVAKEEEDRQFIKKQINDYETYRRVFVKMSNVAESQIHFIYNGMRDYIIRRVEAAVPNAEVIGTGDTFIGIGKDRSRKIIKIVHRPDEAANDSYLGKILQKTRKDINRGSRQPDIILIGGTNLTYTEIPISYQKKEGPTSVVVAQLPTAVDVRSLRDRVCRGIKKGNPLFKLTDTPDFKAGVIVFEWVDGIPREKIFWSDFLTNESIFCSTEKIKEVFKGKNLIYGELEGDEHHGHKFVGWYPALKRPYIKYHSQLIHDFLKDAPICFYLNAGDIVQAHNHEYEEETHPLWLPDFKLKQLIDEKENELKKSNLESEETLKKMLAFVEEILFKNTLYTGILMTGQQIESYVDNRIIPHLAYFYGILKRAKKARIDTRGTLGVINYLAGNHFLNTHGGYFSESSIIARRLIDELKKKFPDLKEKELEELIRAPMTGTVAVSNGMLGINPKAGDFADKDILFQKKYYYYALAGKHKQGSGSSKYSDSMKPMRESVGKRGTTEPFFEGRFIVYWGGHTHYGGVTTSQGSLFIRSGSQTFHDPYGEFCDFPLNNISTEIIGLPKDGPCAGPIVLVHLRYEEFLSYAKKPWKIRKRKLFANSVVDGD